MNGALARGARRRLARAEQPQDGRVVLLLRRRFRPTGDPGELATDPVHRRHLAELHLVRVKVKVRIRVQVRFRGQSWG